MVEIKLKDGQSGYNEVGKYIQRYWDRSCDCVCDVIVSIATSYDGQTYEKRNEVASPMSFNDIEFLYDWWEGETFIRLFGIKAINELDISGGIYR